ncbi:TPA: PAS domain S-box protein, partial [Candidatus Bathyarchaeota archaeon]|nr:PAS domain S-box protein [Candidatus Bathyarchaeota archaeon]
NYRLKFIFDFMEKEKVKDFMEKGQLKLLPSNETYLKKGIFDPDKMINLLREEEKKAIEEGYRALRVAEERTWILEGLPEPESIIKYESKLNDFFPSGRCIALCQYNINTFSPDLLLEVLMVHPHIAMDRRLYRNFFYIPPAEYFKSPSQAKLKHYLQSLKKQTDLIDKISLEEKKYRTLVENASSGILVLKGPKLKILYANKVITDRFDFTLEELTALSPKEIENLIHPEDRRLVLENLKKWLSEEKKICRSKFRIINKDGKIRWLDVNATLIEYDGEPAILAFVNDITERKNFEERLLQERSLFQAFMDSIPDALYFKDIESRFVMVNKAHAVNIGLKNADEAIGKTDFDFYNPRFAREAFEEEQKVIKTGKPLIGKIKKTGKKDGATRWFSVTKVPLKDKSGKIYGLVGISRDITDLKKYQLMLEALHKYAFELRESRTVEKIAEKTLRTVKRIRGDDIVSFGIVDDNVLRFIKTTGLKVDTVIDLPLDGPGVTIRAVKTGKTQLVPDTTKDKDYVWPFKGVSPCKSEIAVPIKVGKVVAAVINVESFRPNAFSKQDREILEILGMHIS